MAEQIIDAAAYANERQELCLRAAWEMDKLARILPGMVPLDDEQNHFAVRGIAGRMLRLTSVLMSGLGDDDEENSDLKRIVFFEDGGQG